MYPLNSKHPPNAKIMSKVRLKGIKIPTNPVITTANVKSSYKAGMGTSGDLLRAIIPPKSHGANPEKSYCGSV